MIYSKRTILILYLMVCLPASQCQQSKGLPLKEKSKKEKSKEALDTAKNNHTSIPVFISKLSHSTNGDADIDHGSNNYETDHNPYNNSSYGCSYVSSNQTDNESGYGSDDESDAQPMATTLPSSTSEKNNLDLFLKEAIEGVRKQADQSRDITWDLSEDKLTRRVGKNCNSLYAAEDYVVIGLNIYRAAKKICELYGKNQSEIIDDASGFLNYYNHKFLLFYDYEKNSKIKEEAHWIKTLKNINEQVVLYLQTKVFPTDSTDAINKKLRLAENYVSLEDTHYDVTTIFTINDKEFGLEDKKCFPLTTDQQKKIENRHSEQWYKRLDSFEKKFVDAYAPTLLLLGDKKFLPTQLRAIIGLRNAYEKNIWYHDKNGKKTLLGNYYHSGSLTCPNKPKDDASIQADKEITKQNWEQVQQKAKHIAWLSLNRNMGGENIPVLKKLSEKKIVEDTQEVVGHDQFINFSINELSTKPIFKHPVSKLPNNLPASNKNLDQNKEVEDQKRKKYCKSLTALQKAAKQSDIGNCFKQNINTKDNYFAKLAADYTLSKILLGENIGISCKSGKDRTGMMSSWIDSKVIRAHYPYLDKKNSPVYKHLVYSGHYQLLASINGGTPGRFGMKSVKKNAEAHDFSKPLFCKAASLTDIKLDTNKQIQEENISNSDSDKEMFLPNLSGVQTN